MMHRGGISNTGSHAAKHNYSLPSVDTGLYYWTPYSVKDTGKIARTDILGADINSRFRYCS